jgi:hypothetical protein
VPLPSVVQALARIKMAGTDYRQRANYATGRTYPMTVEPCRDISETSPQTADCRASTATYTPWNPATGEFDFDFARIVPIE